jgi:hypothetical protein
MLGTFMTHEAWKLPKGEQYGILGGGAGWGQTYFDFMSIGWGNSNGQHVYVLFVMVAISLGAFYAAQRINLSLKDVVKTLLIFSPFTVVMAMIWNVTQVHWTDMLSGDFARSGVRNWQAVIYASKQQYGQPTTLEYWSPGITAAVIGFIAIMALFILRARWPGMRIHPVGVFISFMFPGALLALIIVIVLKHLTVRIGGADAYENIGKPFAVGSLVGFGLMLAIIQTVHFFAVWRSAIGGFGFVP